MERGNHWSSSPDWEERSSFWKKYVPLLTKSHQVVVLDNRGAGETEYPPTLFTMRTMADDMAGLMEHLGHDRYHVLGWSMGGNVAQGVAMDHSKSVGSLVLMSTYTRRPERSSFAIDTMITTPSTRGRPSIR